MKKTVFASFLVFYVVDQAHGHLFVGTEKWQISGKGRQKYEKQ